jgi:hypothetical protein
MHVFEKGPTTLRLTFHMMAVMTTTVPVMPSQYLKAY